MQTTAILERARLEQWSDEEVVNRILAGEVELFELIMRRHNQRLYRAARAILRDDAEAEDVIQDAYVKAYEHLRQFEGRSQFSTWLTRIAVHESLARLHQKAKTLELEAMSEFDENAAAFPNSSPLRDPEENAAKAEVSWILEQAILNLPDGYRSVLVLRDVEELSTAECADVLDISEETVKTRLHRARRMLRKELYVRAGMTITSAFGFMGERCDRVVKAVFERISTFSPQ
jgi:RNA polymerase sigma-70 factor, ECF subfamily